MSHWIKKQFPYILIVVFALAVTLLRPDVLFLPEKLQDTITLSLGVLYEAFPFVVLGIVFSITIQLFIPDDTLERFSPKNNALRRLTVSLSGSLLPVCECGNVPLARGLLIRGFSPSEALTFILAAPIINPVTALTTWHAFPSNPEILAWRLSGAFLIANAIGWIFSKTKPQAMLTPNFVAQCKIHSHDGSSIRRQRNKFIVLEQFSYKFKEELTALLPSLVAGSLMAGVIQTAIPRSFLLHVASNPVVSIIAMILLAFVISICANVDAFFALSLSGVFPLGAIIAFLVFGPMIDLKMLALLKTTFQKSILFWLTVLVFLFSMCIGLGALYVL